MFAIADILLVTATEIETQAVLAMVEQQTQQSWSRHSLGGNIYYDLGVLGGAAIFLVQSSMGATSLGASAQTIQQSIEALNPIAIIMVGIAFGMDARMQRVGDVLIADQILLYEPQRIGSDPTGQPQIRPRGTCADVSPWLLKAFRSGSLDWSPEAAQTARAARPPRVHVGLIFSGEKLIDNVTMREQLRQIEPEAIGGEMEGAGLYVAAQKYKVDWILVKAICDWADGHKAHNKRHRQHQAARNAAHFLFHVIQQGGITRVTALHPSPGPLLHAAAPLHRRSPALHQLRAPVGDFVGRTTEIAQLTQVLQHAVTIDGGATITSIQGMGGIGKTELAYVIAAQFQSIFPDAQIVLTLRGTSSTPLTSEQALQIILRAFDPDTKLADDLDALQGRYRSYLHTRRVLILADDAHDAAQVRPLLPPPGSALLLTSRQRFSLPGMQTIDLGVLPEGDATWLLRAICPRIRDDASDLARLCGYLPLALRISASLLANIDTYPVARYLSQLATERLKYLRDPDAPDDPQASVEASFALSYHVLDPAARTALAWLSVFPADFDRSAAVALLAPVNGDGDLLLGQLRRRSLLDCETLRMRYQLHDLVRAFAAQRLHNPQHVQQRHAAYFLALVEQTSVAVESPHIRQWFEAIDQELEHIRAALRWLLDTADMERALRLALALGPFWLGREHIREGREWLHRLLAQLPVMQTLEQAQSQARATLLLADLTRLQGDLPTAREHYERAGTLFLHVLEDEEAYADVLFNLGILAADQYDHHATLRYFTQCLELLRQQKRPQRIATTLGNLGRVTAILGDIAAAERFYAEGATILRMTDHHEELAWLLVNLAWFRSDYSDREVALQDADESLRLFDKLGHRTGIAWAAYRKGAILADLGRYTEAAAILQRSLADFEEMTTMVGLAMCHTKLTSITLAQGHTPEAWSHAARGLEYYQALENQMGLGLGLEHVAMLVIEQHTSLAVWLFGCAETQLATRRSQMAPIDRPHYEHALAIARAQLGEEAFAVAWAEGQAMPLEQAVALALQASARA